MIFKHLGRHGVHALVAALLMVTSVFVTAAITPTTRLSEILGPVDLERSIPRSFATWQLDPHQFTAVVNPQQEELLGKLYSQTLSRTYIDEKGRRVMLSIAYGEDQRDSMQVHKPEICYPAQGFMVLKKSAAGVPIESSTLPVSRLETVLADRRYEPVTYWVVLASEVSTGGTAKKLEEMKYGLRGVIPDGLIFRVSTIGRDTEAGFRVQESFLQDLLSSMAPETRKRIAGI
jgi:EpsI family protein